ncbi:MAG: hypothetical protein KAR38_02510, partial [Calditrichia bacterium]|nr:hypothetical protein [Calditrichia bacterium]
FRKKYEVNELDPRLAPFIFSKLEEGIFFLNNDFIVLDGYTSVLENMIDEEDLLNQNFIQILEHRIPQDTVKSTEEYISLMFREDLDEEMILELNPLSNIEFHFKDSLGLWTFSKFLSFNFKRIYHGKHIIKILCIIKDISKEVKVVESLAKSQEQNKKQMEWMINILHIKPSFMQEFMNLFEFKLNKIENILKNSMTLGDNTEVANEIFGSIQMIARNVAVLDLKFFKENTQRLLKEIEKIKIKKNISGTDFVPIVLHIGKLRKKYNEIQALISQLNKFKNSLRTTRRYESELLIGTLDKLIEELGEETGKKINFTHNNFNSADVPYAFQEILKEFLFALTRFVVLYSIEKPEERKAANMNTSATIELETVNEDNRNLIKYRHNGKLIKTERFLQKEIEADLYKTHTGQTEDKKTTLDSKVIQMFFTPLPSITADASEIENSDVLFQDIQLAKKKLAIRGGRIKITFTSEESMEYTISLPKK